MIGKLCQSCEKKKSCDAFGISAKLISRLMIGKSVQKEGEAFPINIYRKDLEEEKLDPKATLTFIDTIASHCIYLK